MKSYSTISRVMFPIFHLIYDTRACINTSSHRPVISDTLFASEFQLPSNTERKKIYFPFDTDPSKHFIKELPYNSRHPLFWTTTLISMSNGIIPSRLALIRSQGRGKHLYNTKTGQLDINQLGWWHGTHGERWRWRWIMSGIS